MKGRFTTEELRLLDRTAERVVSMRLAPAAVFLLESLKPLNFLGGQLLRLLLPVGSALFDGGKIEALAALIEKRDAIEMLLRRIEELDSGARSQEPEARR